MHVVGTAGHVDHGKSALIAALTGRHPDRLKEEQERQMTIDLGFGWLTLPNGEEVGLVDVPGHRDFIENMLAGVGGLDAVMLVVAADEGVMPQTREHLAIVDLLQIPRGLLVLNKIDLVPDEEWLALVEQELQALTQGTVLEGAPLVHVSTKTGVGLETLRQELARLLEKIPPRPDLGRPRLPIDRVFSLSGFGTIVTGTLLDGSLHLGDEVEILPAGRRGRIRGLQTHQKPTERALPGRRTAVNLSGIAVGDIQRGDVLTLPGRYQATTRLDVHIRLLPGIAHPLKHGIEVKVFLGSAERMARLRLLGTDELQGGQVGLAQLELHEPLVAARGDRCILRRPSPPETVGGGVVLDATPPRRYRRFDPNVLDRLTRLQGGHPEDLLLQASLELCIAPLREIWKRAHLDESTALVAAEALIQRGEWLMLYEAATLNADSPIVPAARWQTLTEQAISQVREYHRLYPLRAGIPRQELMSRLQVNPTYFQALLKRWLRLGMLKEFHTCLALPEHEIRLTPKQQAQVQALLERFVAAPYAPPTVSECVQMVGDEVFQALVVLGVFVLVSSEIVFRREDYERMVYWLREKLKTEGRMTVAQVRDLFQTSRKYILPFLEHLDAQGITRREGDYRLLKE